MRALSGRLTPDACPAKGPTDVILNMGEFAWLNIAQQLVLGKNLQQAKDLANTAIDQQKWKDSHGNIVPAVHWKIIGDGTIKFF